MANDVSCKAEVSSDWFQLEWLEDGAESPNGNYSERFRATDKPGTHTWDPS
jgi:hypothetical protein